MYELHGFCRAEFHCSYLTHFTDFIWLADSIHRIFLGNVYFHTAVFLEGKKNHITNPEIVIWGEGTQFKRTKHHHHYHNYNKRNINNNNNNNNNNDNNNNNNNNDDVDNDDDDDDDDDEFLKAYG